LLRRGAPPLPGYTVLGHLHRGQDVDVYDVWSEERWCRCALKLLRSDRLADAGARAALLREAHLLARLSHPHIVRAYEVIDRPRAAVVLETLQGATLEHLIASQGRLATADLVWLGTHLCSALRYLHRHGYLHLDLKASNIVSHAGLAKLLDLNIARPPGPGRPGEGTRHYMAPEQARGGTLSPATDVWGLGAVLFEAATGRLAFEFTSHGPKYPQVEGRAGSIRRHRRLPSRLADLIDGCLAPEPDQRPSVEALWHSFQELARPTGPSQALTAPGAPRSG
jgi:serine/threonine protein kinase